MRIFRSLEDLPRFEKAVVTLGTFDGVHRGHQAVLNLLKEKAREIRGETVLLTFWPHPRLVLNPEDQNIKLLNTLEEKVGLLEKAGLDNLVIIEFTKEFAALDYKEFVAQVLVSKIGTKVLAIGHDHHFGRNREGTFQQLEKLAPDHGFEVVQIPEFREGDENISSTVIRNALLHGETEKANDYLGYPYMVSGTVVHGDKTGRTLGFPTANIKVEEPYKLIPAKGIYITEIFFEKSRYEGVSSLGYRPTFFGKDKTLEVNIFNFDKEIYSEKIIVFFIAYLRDELKFANIEALIRQMNADKQLAIAYFINTLKDKHLEK
ncbi:MAG: bifunctional riboflavin kinase/FAD synthetase [Bacteroidota bacterium]|nr:bifunctional riboflavin kinase/FAD synthetase [Bacteroidota bacterium]